MRHSFHKEVIDKCQQYLKTKEEEVKSITVNYQSDSNELTNNICNYLQYSHMFRNGELIINEEHLNNLNLNYNDIADGYYNWSEISLLDKLILIAFIKFNNYNVTENEMSIFLVVNENILSTFINNDINKRVISEYLCFFKNNFIKQNVEMNNNYKKEDNNFDFINDNFEMYLKSISEYFTLSEPTVEDKIINLLTSEKRYFTEKEILSYIKTDYDFSTLQSCLIENKMNEQNELQYCYKWIFLNIPTFTGEHDIEISKFKTYQNNEIDKFDFNNFLNLSSFKQSILIYKRQLMNNEFKDSISDSINNYLSIDLKNNFVIDNFRKIFKLETSFLCHASPLNNIVYRIVNSFVDNSLDDMITTWLSVKKVFDKNFIVNNEIRNNLNSFVNKLINSYPVYNLNGLCIFNKMRFPQPSKKETNTNIKKKEKIGRRPNYKISNDKIYLLKSKAIGETKLYACYCFNELQNNLRQILTRYKSISLQDIKSFILDMDYIPFNIPELDNKSGFMVGYCDYRINSLLTMFKFEDRLLYKILNYHTIQFSSLEEAKDVNYNYLKSAIDEKTLLQWENENKQKVNDFKKRVDEQLQKRLSSDEIDYLIVENNFYIIDDNLYRQKRNQNDPIHNKYKNLIFDHSHGRALDLFNYFIKYFNLSNEKVSTNEEMYKLYQNIRKDYGNDTCYFIKYFLVSHLDNIGRGFIDNHFNTRLGYLEKLTLSKWDYDSIFEELTNWLNRDPIVDSDGNLIIYY
ncbi:hypothetical protein ABK040_011036 [Willaertia magna]